MLALLAAATVAVGPTDLPPPRAHADRTPNAYAVPDHCRAMRDRVAGPPGRPIPERLDQLPAGGLMLLVDRRINGCPVITMRFGSPPLDNPNPPRSAYRIVPLQPD